MRRLLVPFAVLCVLLLGSESPKVYDDQTETNGIEGTWCTSSGQILSLRCGKFTWQDPAAKGERVGRLYNCRRPQVGSPGPCASKWREQEGCSTVHLSRPR
jgi:hypothetical protein